MGWIRWLYFVVNVLFKFVFIVGYSICIKILSFLVNNIFDLSKFWWFVNWSSLVEITLFHIPSTIILVPLTSGYKHRMSNPWLKWTYAILSRDIAISRSIQKSSQFCTTFAIYCEVSWYNNSCGIILPNWYTTTHVSMYQCRRHRSTRSNNSSFMELLFQMLERYIRRRRWNQTRNCYLRTFIHMLMARK